MTNEILKQAQDLNKYQLAVTDVLDNINQNMDIIISCGADKKLTLPISSGDGSEIDEATTNSRNAIIKIIKAYQEKINELFTNL